MAQGYNVHHVQGNAKRRVDGGPLVMWNAVHCPFAQRLWIALAYKDVPYERRDIDHETLYKAKPEGLLKINPNGLVPALDDNGKYLYESMICVEYVDEVFDSSVNILPKDPHQRAVSKLLVDFISKRFVPHFYRMLMRQNSEEQEEEKKHCLQFFEEFSNKLSETSNGPFMFGEHFGFVDICLAPYAHRLEILKHFRGFEVPNTSPYQRFHVWWKAVQNVEAFKETRQSIDFLITAYEAYAQNTATSKASKAINKGDVIP